MDARFRIISGLLLAVAIAVIAVQEQIGAIIPQTPIYAMVFTLLIIVLREIVKAYGSNLQGIVMDVKYRTVSVILLAIALGIITLETTLTSSFPQYATAISMIIIVLRELVKDKGLKVGEETTVTTTQPTQQPTQEPTTETIENPEDEV